MTLPIDAPSQGAAITSAPADLLIISSDDETRAVIAELLAATGHYQAVWALPEDSASGEADTIGCRVVLVDAGPEGGSAPLVLAERWAAEGRAVIILHSGKDVAIESLAESLGAADCLRISDLTPALLDRVIRHAITMQALSRDLHHMRLQRDLVVDNAPVIFFTIDRNGIFRVLQGRALAELGTAPQSMVGRSIFEVYRDDPRILKNVVRVLSGETFEDIVTVGDLVYECHYVPTRNLAGQIDGLMGVATDRTALARGEEERQQIEDRFRAIWNSAGDAVLLLNPQGIVIEANPSFYTLCGYTPLEVIGRRFTFLFSPDQHSYNETRFRDFFSGEPTRPAYEFSIFRKDGEERIVEGHVNFIEHNGQRVSMLALIRDITERKRIDRALRESEEHFRLLTENALDIITVIRSDGTIEYESPSLERVLGFKPEELVGNNAFSYIHPEDLPGVLEVFLEAIRYPGRSAGAEFRFLNSRGEWQYLETIGTNLIDHPVIQGVVLNSRDVTGRKMAEEQLRQMNDMLETRVQERTTELIIAMGQLEQAHITQKRFIADASHDLRTPLTVIGIEVDLLLETGGYDEGTTEALRMIKAEAERLNHLANDLLVLATLDGLHRTDSYKRIRFDEFLLELVKQITSLAQERAISWNVQIGEAIEYRCDVRMMESAFVNLLENAIKYSHPGGVVDVAMRLDGDAIVVTITDQGMGIPAADLDRVFERFYRSDSARSTPGTGLGLSMVKAVVDAHNGTVKLQSQPGHGTTVTITLPLGS